MSKINFDRVEQISRVVFILVIIILAGWFGYYQVRLRKADKQLKQIEQQYNEITQEYQSVREQYINEINGVE